MMINDLYEQLAELDKEISIIENRKKNYFFDNVDIKDKEGSVELPLIATNKSSDYEKLTHEIKSIQMQIYMLTKQLDVSEFKDDILEKINILKQKLVMIDGDPKIYLRFKEYECCNYSSVKDRKVVSELKIMDKELAKKQKLREKILFQIRKISKQNEEKKLVNHNNR